MEKEYFVHPSSYVEEGCEVGENTRIWHFSHVMQGARIGCGCNIGEHVFIESGVQLGNGVKVKNNISLYDGLVCEDDVFLGPACVFTNVINPRSFVPRKDEFKKTVIHKGASIGAGAVIVCGHDIGKYALIGAGAVVTKDIPDHALAYGNPARVHGHVCQCGELLHFSEGKARCSRCGLQYHREGDGVALDQDTDAGQAEH